MGEQDAPRAPVPSGWGWGRDYGDFIAVCALGHGTMFGRDFFERRETEEPFLIQAKFGRSDIQELRRIYSAQ